MTRYEYVKTVLEPRFKDELYHYGTPRHSGRYPYGSGKRPFQGGDPDSINNLRKERALLYKKYQKARDERNKVDDRIDAEFEKMYPDTSNMTDNQIMSAFTALEIKYGRYARQLKMGQYQLALEQVDDRIEKAERKDRLAQNANTPLSSMNNDEKRQTLRDIANTIYSTRKLKDSNARVELKKTVNEMVNEYNKMGADGETWSHIVEKYRPKVYSLYEDNAKEIINCLEDQGLDIEKITGAKHPVKQLMILNDYPIERQNKSYAEMEATMPFDELIDDVNIADPSVWMDWFDLGWNATYNG